MHVGIVHYAAPPVVGGVELTIYHHTRVLLAEGHQVTVVAGRGATRTWPSRRLSTAW